MKGSAWLIGAAGAWLAASPFLGFVPPDTRWNDLAVGVIVAVLGVKVVRAKRTYGWVAAALGVWLLGVASLSAKAALGAVWHDVAVGAVLVVAGLVGVASEAPAPPIDLFPRPPGVGAALHRHQARIP